MAISRFSTPFQISAPTQVVNEAYVDDVFSTKQAKYDQGYINLKKNLQSYDALDLVRPEDIEYKNRKVAELTEKLNNYGNVDFSDPKESAKLELEAQSLMKDKDLMGRLSATKNFRRLTERYEMLKTDPKRLPYYSEINEWHDMKQVRDWMDGKTPTLNISSPTLKTDKDKIVGDVLKTMKPQTYSYANGLYMVNGEILSGGDLKNQTLNTLQSNPSIAAQLQRDAQYVFRNASPEDIYEQAMSTAVDDISTSRESLLNYENQLKDASISADVKANLTAKVTQLKNNIVQKEQQYQDLSQKFNKGDVSDFENLKYNIFANNWVESVVSPYIVQKEKVTANQVGLALRKEQSDAVKETARMQFQSQQNQLDRESKARSEMLDTQVALSKIGQKLDVDKYMSTGEISIGTDDSAVNSAYYQLPVLQGEAGVDSFAEINTKSQQYKNENRQLVSQLTKDILNSTDKPLLAQIKPLLDTGNLFDDQGKFLGDSKTISPAQIKLLKQYDELLDNASKPEFIKNNSLLSKYGNYKNLMIENQIKWTALDGEKARVEKEVFEDAWKKGEFKGTWNDFQNVLKNEVKAVSKSSTRPDEDISMGERVAAGMSPSLFNNNYESNKFIKRVSEKLSNSPRKNEFYTARAIAEEDKIYNNPESPIHTRVQDLAFKNGALINGVATSLNGSIQGGKTFRDDLPNVESIRVRGIVPNTDRLEVDLMRRTDPSKKDLTPVRATIQLNPDEMKSLYGRGSADAMKTDFNKSLVNGEMKDQFGNPLYFNLNGDNPGMMGNIQYRVWNFDDKTSVSLKIPTVNGDTEINIKDMEWEGENSLQGVKSYLVKVYNDTFQYIKSNNTNMTPEEVSKLTLQTIYKKYDNN